jgi:hypothetical protein
MPSPIAFDYGLQIGQQLVVSEILLETVLLPKTNVAIWKNSAFKAAAQTRRLSILDNIKTKFDTFTAAGIFK